MSNKDLLKLENEFRNDLPKYKEKPKITPIERPHALTKKVTSFLTNIQENNSKMQTTSEEKQIYHQVSESTTGDSEHCIRNKSTNAYVEMDIFITPQK